MNLQKIAAVVVILLFTVLAINNTVSNQNKLELKNIQLKSTATQIKTLELKYDNLQIELNKTDKTNTEQIKKLQDEKNQLEQQRIQLQQQLEAKKASKLQVAATSIPGQGTASAASGCGTDPYMAQIYMRESGCRTTALNSIGCYGIGQACPASKIAQCGSDFACQDAWFRNYAISRYGSYAGAWAAWQRQGWWQ